MNATRQYAVVTASYWAFTITDGALRMLVVLYFHQLGFSPFDIAALFILYELCGVFTNLVGGWLGKLLGLLPLMQLGLILQLSALSLLSVPDQWLTVPYVMVVQAVSGVAKDLNKMSAKSSVKTLVPAYAQGQLLKWVAILTGSKNALKGAGFFVGALLLGWLGFRGALVAMIVPLFAVLLISSRLLKGQLGKVKAKSHWQAIFAKSRAVNVLSSARFFLFGARDIWFVVALPVFLSEFGWPHQTIGAFMAVWIMGYGVVQMFAPKFLGSEIRDTRLWVWSLTLMASVIVILLLTIAGLSEVFVVVSGLLVFGFIFAINSSLHSYLILAHADNDKLSLDVGFYYMANACGRLVGTLMSGYIYQKAGMQACLWWSAVFLLASSIIAMQLPQLPQHFSIKQR